MNFAGKFSIAVCGIGAIFPDAPDTGRFWENIRSGRSATRQVPEGRWAVSPGLLFDPEPGKADRLYSLNGCFIDELPPLTDLAGLDLGLSRISGLDPLFQLVLHAGRRAFNDAVTAPLDLSRVGVVIGNLALPSEKSSLLARQWLGRTFAEKLRMELPGLETVDPLNRYVAGLPAGLLAQALGLGGGSCTLDAACASSLYAIRLAAMELLSGRADAMLTGGVSRPDSLYTQMGFSQLRALSPKGVCSPFDARGDGLVVGEGAGIFLLKRTADAVAHGDRIYGIIRGIGLANDVGGSLLAPLSEGQLRAMRAAYAQSGWEPRDVDLIECHATGTPVGDAVEFASLRELWGDLRAEESGCVIGSVKSNIGHLLTAAGGAALTKVLLAMASATLPPTANFSAPPPAIDLENSPFRVLTTEEPWHRRGDDIPRRAAVSAFGFGGINAHLLVEEWLPTPDRSTSSITSTPSVPSPAPVAIVGMDARFGPWQSLSAFQERVLGGERSTTPIAPCKWWGAEESAWFATEGHGQTPFKGYFLDEVAIAPGDFRIPPKEMEEMLPQQLLMLQVAAAAMANAGLGRDGNERGGVFIGIALDLNTTNFSFRWSLAEDAAAWAQRLSPGMPAEELGKWVTALKDAAGPPLTANRTMGALGSIVASRIAREFRFGGPSFTLSSEENSGVRALEAAVRLLQDREIDRALVGAVDLPGDIRSALGHHGVRPYSPSGRGIPFSENADGAVIGEGAAAFVLKRLEDAEADGDRIYAVIKGIGTSGGRVVLPGEGAYGKALERAFGEAGVEPATVSFLEAGAAGSPAEDLMEAKTLAAFFAHASRECAISGVKGEIGHCGAASGLASLARGCLALYQELIPPGMGTEKPIAPFADAGPFYLPPTPRYWLRDRASGPRRAGVSSFGVDGSCSHIVLEGYERQPPRVATERARPLGTGGEFLFTVTGSDRLELERGLDTLRKRISTLTGEELRSPAGEWHSREENSAGKPLAAAMVARNRTELAALIEQGVRILGREGDACDPLDHPSLRGRLFHSPQPLRKGKIAFVYPGSGNHYPGMGAELSALWPELFRQRDISNLRLASQFQPRLIWNGAPLAEINDDPRAVIFSQVALGSAVTDIVRHFGVNPHAVIGYSLGESAGLFALDAWRDRDGMLARMEASTLFTRDLAGECRAARSHWGMGPEEELRWRIGVVDAPAAEVRKAIGAMARVYLLIVNTPEECVIGGHVIDVESLVARLGCRFFPLQGVTTAHCAAAGPVAEPYRELHRFEVFPPPEVTFYSPAWGRPYHVDRENAADSMLAQALDGIDYPRVIESAYADGVRIFIEMGPGSSCSRMISRILAGRPHMARSACFTEMEPESAILRLLGHLVAERVKVDLSPLYPREIVEMGAATGTAERLPLRVRCGGKSFRPPLPPPSSAPLSHVSAMNCEALGQSASTPSNALEKDLTVSEDSPLRQFAAAQEANLAAHDAYLRFSEQMTRSMGEALALHLALQQTLGEDASSSNHPAPERAAQVAEQLSSPAREGETQPSPLFDRDMCLEFARGLVGRMLGPAFAEADTFPTRVRLPDEPLMLVDRIVALEGEARSMTGGRVVTEHDIHENAWYLDAGRIPTCIAVEAGQADLFLSGYLGIDFVTRGLAVYRLLDAVVTFHRELPGPGETIHYDIRIERFFQQGETRLFRFRFDATVNGVPLLTMRDGCAGFFTAAELTAGRGIVKKKLDLAPRSGTRPDDWVELVPLLPETYDADSLDRLRDGDLAGCFGPLFAGLGLASPLTIPGGRMRLVHRVTALEPTGGRYGLGMIRAEAEIRPDDWFLTCHFTDDRVMPGTLMYECCLHTLRIFLLRMGWVAETADAAWEPVPGVASRLCCRGQVLETTRTVTYEVTIRELGYRPEPFAVVDALMYADDKPIVEITGMSARLSGTTKEALVDLWQGRSVSSTPLPKITGDGRKTAVYTKEQILAYSNGRPSEGFGERYRVFDSERIIARLPGPPFQFMDRVTAVKGEPWRMEAGARVEAQYDVPPDAWYFSAERQPIMPFSVLLEAALQPCGWLAAYVGSALTSPTDLSFRNLGGNAVRHRAVTPESGTLTAVASLTKVATSGGMIIQEYSFAVSDQTGAIYEGDTMFGFFSRDALANQVGIRDAAPYKPSPEEIRRGKSLPYPDLPPFPEKKLRMIDLIELCVADGGPAGLGYIRGLKVVDPNEWFFKAHFFQDPVTPGSLGLESFLQLLKYLAVERWGWRESDRFSAMAPKCRHDWLYRGQVVPTNRQVIVEAWLTAVDDGKRVLTAEGLLSVDGRPIYRMKDFTLGLE